MAKSDIIREEKAVMIYVIDVPQNNDNTVWCYINTNNPFLIRLSLPHSLF